MPWTHNVWRIHVTNGFDDSAPGIKWPIEPWALTTGAGPRFGFLQGGTSAVHGLRVNDSSAYTGVVLVGNVHKDRRVWRIRTA
jgi:hypothetical protein